MRRRNLFPARVVVGLTIAFGSLIAHAHASTISFIEDPVCAAGICTLDKFSLLGAPLNFPFFQTTQVDITFPGTTQIQLETASTLELDISIRNNSVANYLLFGFTFGLLDQNGSVIATLPVLPFGTAIQPTQTQLFDFPLHPLPSAAFHGVRLILIEEYPLPQIVDPSNTFDFTAGGDLLNGDIVFNRASKIGSGTVPEPPLLVLVALGVAALGGARFPSRARRRWARFPE